MAILKIRVIGGGEDDWIPLPNPAELQYTTSDMDAEDGTGRNQEGKLFRDRVATKMRITAKWPILSASSVSTILSNVSDVFFELSYPDESARKTITVYVGDRERTVVVCNSDNNMLIDSLSFAFIEQ